MNRFRIPLFGSFFPRRIGTLNTRRRPYAHDHSIEGSGLSPLGRGYSDLGGDARPGSRGVRGVHSFRLVEGLAQSSSDTSCSTVTNRLTPTPHRPSKERPG